jgi:hypothetical protein
MGNKLALSSDAEWLTRKGSSGSFFLAATSVLSACSVHHHSLGLLLRLDSTHAPSASAAQRADPPSEEALTGRCYCTRQHGPPTRTHLHGYQSIFLCMAMQVLRRIVQLFCSLPFLAHHHGFLLTSAAVMRLVLPARLPLALSPCAIYNPKTCTSVGTQELPMTILLPQFLRASKLMYALVR